MDSTANDLVWSSEQITALVERVVHEKRIYTERRTERRYPVALLVSVQLLDEHFEEIGNPFKAATRDISNNGISIFALDHFDTPYITVELTDEDGTTSRLVVEVLRCRYIEPLYEIGGRFVRQRQVQRMDGQADPERPYQIERESRQTEAES